MTAAPLADTREAQAERPADFMEAHPEGTTVTEINAAADLGSATKVLSVMRRELGYGIRRGPDRRVVCARSNKRRRVRTYVLTHRPARAVQLPLALE